MTKNRSCCRGTGIGIEGARRSCRSCLNQGLDSVAGSLMVLLNTGSTSLKIAWNVLKLTASPNRLQLFPCPRHVLSTPLGQFFALQLRTHHTELPHNLSSFQNRGPSLQHDDLRHSTSYLCSMIAEGEPNAEYSFASLGLEACLGREEQSWRRQIGEGPQPEDADVGFESRSGRDELTFQPLLRPLPFVRHWEKETIRIKERNQAKSREGRWNQIQDCTHNGQQSLK
jgi:hypothetical protein